jgi:hypothetical protein
MKFSFFNKIKFLLMKETLPSHSPSNFDTTSICTSLSGENPAERLLMLSQLDEAGGDGEEELEEAEEVKIFKTKI